MKYTRVGQMETLKGPRWWAFSQPKDHGYPCAKGRVFDHRLQRVTVSQFKVVSSTENIENRPEVFKKEGTIVTY
jgi:hypothetical protein